MTVRGTFYTELEELKEDIMFLGSRVEKAFQETVAAISANDESKLEEIIEGDQDINSMELEVNEKATLLIARQQPVASDLRKIVVTLKISSDLERMGDLSVDMAKAALRIKDSALLENYQKDLLPMTEKTHIMFRKVMNAYKESKIVEAQHIATLDDDIDDAYSEFVKTLFQITLKEGWSVEGIAQMAFICRYIERIADYCTNIAEWIIYEANGQRFDLN